MLLPNTSLRFYANLCDETKSLRIPTPSVLHTTIDFLITPFLKLITSPSSTPKRPIIPFSPPDKRLLHRRAFPSPKSTDCA
mmetsp:Transcript_20262/g.43421  ORF Transcript_20262/g.43421 Transcript_20262/m.43421 type:complete len:81 (-) Transcript_20262:220-462(-)